MLKKSDALPASFDPVNLQLFGGNRTKLVATVTLCAALEAVPLLTNGYILTQLTFVAIYALAGLGLQILLGFAGQVSLGQAAFVCIGAYASTFAERLGANSALGLVAAMLSAMLVGLAVALPALRLAGLYLAIATMSFGFIVEEVAARWVHVTGGNAGTVVTPLAFAGRTWAEPWHVYALSWALLGVALVITANLLRTASGRALLAIRDSEIAARSCGVRVARTKGVAFALRAAFAGVTGALYAHAVGFISPEQFTISMSLDLLIMILIGGLGSVRGVLLGAVFVVMSPEAMQAVLRLVATENAELPGLRPLLFGASLIAVLLLEPAGLDAILTALTRRWRGRR